MMSATMLILGLACLAVVTFDLLTVTIGGSWRLSVSVRLARLVFAILRALSRRVGRRLLTELSGIVVMTVVAAFWIVGYWVGWALVFGAFDDVLTLTRTGAEPEAAHVPAHVGHLLSTLGATVTEPSGVGWNLLGAVVGLNGMLALTLSMSFLLNTRATLQQGRAFATLVQTGEARPSETLERLAELVAGLHTIPFALWYGHSRADRRVPRALLILARQAEEEGGAVATRIRAIMRDLPGLDDHDEDFLRAVEVWADRHELPTGPGDPVTEDDAAA